MWLHLLWNVINHCVCNWICICGAFGLNLKDVEMFLSMFKDEIILAWKGETISSKRFGTKPLICCTLIIRFDQNSVIAIHKRSQFQASIHCTGNSVWPYLTLGRSRQSRRWLSQWWILKYTHRILSFEKWIQPFKIHTSDELWEIRLVRLPWCTFDSVIQPFLCMTPTTPKRRSQNPPTYLEILNLSRQWYPAKFLAWLPVQYRITFGILITV